jgi:Fe2+ transport system protein FeoA
MGLRLGVEFDVVSTSQTGPSILSVGNTRLALGHSIASKMMVELVHMERE